ncbi:TPA: hypothetical protein HA281_04215 [Candidatus Woesearchaeota archaeon]|nr:hypothetical protein [Candidatus Woesearchaeota archaeon]HIH91983.1 hypothetical protein [Candidatus Woesearchaeota archaeon]HII64165.1 hypothetical protein [Candidatus Woesearchaeota archaeon]HIJ18773.1 hypothetical protein [Candidatus Woesearchaeota archaeon]
MAAQELVRADGKLMVKDEFAKTPKEVPINTLELKLVESNIMDGDGGVNLARGPLAQIANQMGFDYYFLSESKVPVPGKGRPIYSVTANYYSLKPDK